MKEEMRPVEGFEGYFVTNTGKVWSEYSHKFLKPQHRLNANWKHPNQYVYVKLKDTWLSIHKLVARAFLENPENKTDVDHIDGNKSNNNVNNLRWCTRAENLAFYRENHPEEWERNLKKCHEAAKKSCSIPTTVIKNGVKYEFKMRKEASAFLGITEKIMHGWIRNPSRIPSNIQIFLRGKSLRKDTSKTL